MATRKTTRKTTRKRKKKSDVLDIDQARLLIESALKDEDDIKIFWADFRFVAGKKNTIQLVVDKLSLNFLDKVKSAPLVKDVQFFAKVGSGSHGINLLFKLYIIFEEL